MYLELEAKTFDHEPLPCQSAFERLGRLGKEIHQGGTTLDLCTPISPPLLLPSSNQNSPQ
jgi:hypothetical protein